MAAGVSALAADVVLWRVVSAMFDGERLITGVRPQTASHS
jgi:hypothetical protein